MHPKKHLYLIQVGVQQQQQSMLLHRKHIEKHRLQDDIFTVHSGETAGGGMTNA